MSCCPEKPGDHAFREIKKTSHREVFFVVGDNRIELLTFCL